MADRIPRKTRSVTAPVIGIVGPVGSGKTTLAEGLADRYGLAIHKEKPGENPYWETFYAELKRGGESPVALKSQLYFLLAAFEQSALIAQVSTGVAWDVPFYGHKMYADLLFEQGVMTEPDYRLYCQVYHLCLATAPQPDVLVVTSTDIDTLCARIRQRGREAELDTPREYWERQIQYWEKQTPELQHNIPMVKVNSGELNWLQAQGIETVWEMTQAALPH